MDTTSAAARLLLATGLEVRVADVSRLGEDLLAQIDGADAITAESPRNEATRLFGFYHEIVRWLAAGDVEGAYRVSVGDADQDGDVLGVAV